MSGGGAVPFRWNVARREQLGRLPDAAVRLDPWHEPPPFRELLRDLRECAARVLARAGDARWVFLGRSPENLYDYLGGVLADAPAWAERLGLLNVSMSDSRHAGDADRAAFRAHLAALGLAPIAIAAAPRPVAFVDLVWRGGTFGALSDELCRWAREERVDPDAVRRRLRWVGISVRTKNSPKTWRWFQQAEWAGDYPRSALRGVSIDGWFWGYLGDRQAKTGPSNHFLNWREGLRGPIHQAEHVAALQLTRRIHERGRTPEERARFTTLLVRRPEMREPWLRSLVVALRR